LESEIFAETSALFATMPTYAPLRFWTWTTNDFNLMIWSNPPVGGSEASHKPADIFFPIVCHMAASLAVAVTASIVLKTLHGGQLHRSWRLNSDVSSEQSRIYGFWSMT
jgi:hypothetical protein